VNFLLFFKGKSVDPFGCCLSPPRTNESVPLFSTLSLPGETYLCLSFTSLFFFRSPFKEDLQEFLLCPPPLFFTKTHNECFFPSIAVGDPRHLYSLTHMGPSPYLKGVSLRPVLPPFAYSEVVPSKNTGY